MAFVGFGFGFAFNLQWQGIPAIGVGIVGGLSAPPEQPPGKKLGGNISTSVFVEREGSATIGAFVIANGAEMIEWGLFVASTGLEMAPLTEGTSLLASVAGGALVGLGGMEVGVGLCIGGGTGAGEAR